MAFGLRTVVPTVICLLATQVSAGSLAAWWTDIGPALLVQDDERGGIRYSLCTSRGTPILPQDTTITAPLYKYPPKNGTAITGTGWWDTKITWASIFYQDSSDNIINSYLKCDPNTGYWLSQGDWIISNGAPSISSSTGLASLLLGSTDGYRVFYHDTNMTIRQLGYTTDTNWADKGIVTQDSSLGNTIAATFNSSKSITVTAAKDSENIEVSDWYSDDSWYLSTFPRPLSGNATTNATSASAISLNETTTSNFTLPAWDGSPSSLAISVDKSNKRSIFYIGTDSELYQAANAGSEWQLSSRQNSTLWPKADNAKGELAVASNSQGRQLRVYYESGGEIMELNGDNNRWTAAAVLPNDNSTATTTSSSSGSASSGADASASAAAGSDGLSTGAKIGVGVGVSMGVVAVGGMLGALFFLRKRQQRRDAAAAGGVSTVGGSTVLGGGSSVAQIPSTTGYSAADGYSAYGPQSAGYQHSYGGYEQTGHELQGGWDGYKPVERTIPGELAGGAPAVHEMPPNHYHHEMMGEGHYREAP